VGLTTLSPTARRPSAGFEKRPARIVLAVGSTDLIAVAESETSLPYSVGLGFATKYLKFGSFQICQAWTGSAGTSGFSLQKVPVAPYRATAALRNAVQAVAAVPVAGRW